MKMIDLLLIIICTASVFFNFAGLTMDLFGGFKRKKIDKHEDSVTSGYMRHDRGVGIVGTMNNQIVYKVNGDFNGNIKGDNVTVILIGDGNINGNIESKDGNVVLIRGNVNGDIKANKVICPTEPTTEAKCSDCVFAENKHYISASGIFSEGYYDCSKFNKTVNEDCSACLKFKSRSKNKDVESPKLQVKTLWSCYIPQGTSPQKRIDHYTSIGNNVSIYDSFPVAHIKCPHCKKYFATQVKVHTSVVDGDVVETSVEEIKRDY